MTSLPIDKGIPIPRPSTNRAKRLDTGGRGNFFYPLPLMEVGDSFLVPVAEDEYRPRAQSRVSSAITSHANAYPGRKYVTRVLEGGVRVWRVA